MASFLSPVTVAFAAKDVAERGRGRRTGKSEGVKAALFDFVFASLL
jgi:hypothetical protein